MIEKVADVAVVLSTFSVPPSKRLLKVLPPSTLDSRLKPELSVRLLALTIAGLLVNVGGSTASSTAERTIVLASYSVFGVLVNATLNVE